MPSRVVLALLSMLCLPAVADAAPKQVNMMRLTADLEVAAAPGMVWVHLTSGKSLVTWCPEWASEANAAIRLSKVGDVLDFTDAGGNGGRSVVTFFEKDRELRVAHEPSDGSYVCQARILLEPTDGGTRVRYVECYTDESGLKERRTTAEKTESKMAATLEKLKAQVEKK